jgi:hypothetical protein
LDHILVKGEAQPPYSPYSDQTITFDDDLEYRAFDGCNEIFNCRKLSSGEKVCEQTLSLCRMIDEVTGESIPISWEGPFGAAIYDHTWSQLRDGFLYWHTSLADDTVLVFRSIDAKPTDATPAYPTATPIVVRSPLPSLITHPRPDFSVDLTAFQEAGCTTNNGVDYHCDYDSPVRLLGCKRVYPYDLLGALTPAVPLICESDYPPTALWQYYERWGSCERWPDYRSYVIFMDNSFQLIKPHDVLALRAVFAPITSSDEALSFALAATYFHADYDTELDPQQGYLTEEIENTYTESVEDGFVVHLFYGPTPLCGCEEHNTYAVDVFVTPDGEIEQRTAWPIYRNFACYD